MGLDDRERDDWDEPLGPVDRDIQAALVEHQAIQRARVSQVQPLPSEWIDRVRSGDIPPHDGRRCPECGYPLTEANVWRGLWWLCPVCDTVDKGEDQPS